MTSTFTPPASDDLALITFTSGTEGNPKGVMLTHNNLADVITRLNTLMQVNDSIREYIGVPVYHSFGLGRCRAVASVGGRFFIPDNFNPSQIGEMLKKGTINAISAVPSLWRILLANQDLIGRHGKRVQWIEIGSQYMSQAEKEALKILFPNARIVQHYGLTEASRTTLLEIHQEEGEKLESVGRALGDVEIKLTADQNIAIRGPHVAAGYIIDGQETSLKDEAGWLVTKDLGNIDDGYLYYQGRADDIINCGGIKISPEALETKVYAELQLESGLAICRKPDPMRGDGFLVAITQETQLEKQKLHETVLRATQELGVNAANAISIVEVENLPKTASGKVQRRKLTDWYIAQKIVEEPTIDIDDTKSTTTTPIQQAFYKTLNIRHTLQPEDTFISLGGDSLSYIQVSMALERHIGYLPKNWENFSLRELEALEPKQQQTSIMESNIVFRALAITGVVVNHSGLIPTNYIAGGAMLLFLIAGMNFARFQGEAVLQGRWLQSATSLLQNLLIPYLIIALAFETFKFNYDPAILLLYSNFIGPGTSNMIFPAWFIQVLAQCIILFTLIFSISAVRNLANLSSWKFGLVVLAIAIGLRLFVPYVWDTDYLYNRVPHMQIWLIALGWCLHFSQSRFEKLSMTLILLTILAFVLNPESSRSWWIIGGGMMMLWIPYIPIWKMLKSAIQTISASAYYIYLTHMIFIHIVLRALKIDSPLLNVTTALLGGIVTWIVLQNLLQWVFQKIWTRQQSM
ncbi:AMP-dependent synthetase and ligase [Beggiatoa sp. PS]|nr:AMP-dependent synthetase and ligase [Beggiatoa sp. PS]